MVPQCAILTEDLELGVKGESVPGDIKVFLGKALTWKYPFFFFFFFWLGIDVKESCPCFDGVVCCAVFNIHAADREGRKEGEEIFGQTES